MLLTVAQPVAEFDTEVEELLGMCVVTPCPPRPEDFAFDTPTVGLAQRTLHLYVWCDDTPKQQVGLDGPSGIKINRRFVLRTWLRKIDDGVADDDGVALRWR